MDGWKKKEKGSPLEDGEKEEEESRGDIIRDSLYLCKRIFNGISNNDCVYIEYMKENRSRGSSHVAVIHERRDVALIRLWASLECM